MSTRAMAPGEQRRGRLASVTLNLALIGVSLLLAVGAAELFLRLFPRFLPLEEQSRLHWAAVERMTGTSGERLIEDDDYLAFRYRPHATRTDGANETSFAITTDEHGFRNPSPWPERAEIVVVGDSMALGYGVTREESWAGLLAAALAPVHLINLARSGYGPQQYTRAYARFGMPLQARVLLYTLFLRNDVDDADDFARWLASGRPGRFLVWRNAPAPSERKRGRLLPTMLAFADRSYLTKYLRGAMRELRSPYRSQTLTLPDGSRVRLFPASQARQAARIFQDHPEFQAVMAAIEEARARALSHGTRFLLLLMPSKEDIYLPLLGQQVPELFQSFIDAFKARGIDHLDLRPALREAAPGQHALYFEADGHLNVQGNRVIADAVLRRLQEGGYLEPPD